MKLLNHNHYIYCYVRRYLAELIWDARLGMVLAAAAAAAAAALNCYFFRKGKSAKNKGKKCGERTYLGTSR